MPQPSSPSWWAPETSPAWVPEMSGNILQGRLPCKCWKTQAGVLYGLGHPRNPGTTDHSSDSETFSLAPPSAYVSLPGRGLPLRSLNPLVMLARPWRLSAWEQRAGQRDLWVAPPAAQSKGSWHCASYLPCRNVLTPPKPPPLLGSSQPWVPGDLTRLPHQ